MEWGLGKKLSSVVDTLTGKALWINQMEIFRRQGEEQFKDVR